MTSLSVVLPTHNPNRDRLAQALSALGKQTLSADKWEVVIIDNQSTPVLAKSDPIFSALKNVRLVREEQLGLTHARLAGIRETYGDLIIFVDDDNLLHPDFLQVAQGLFQSHARLGAAGGKVLPVFDSPPPEWCKEFYGNLALCDHGAVMKISPEGQRRPIDYPNFSPIGAGMVVRRTAALAYVKSIETSLVKRDFDRRGTSLTSGGDNDLVMTIIEAGWQVAYSPSLQLQHLIPENRLRPEYLSRLNFAIAESWVRLLKLHGICPWKEIPAWTVWIRQRKAWLGLRAWKSPANFIRWRYACGHFAGLARLKE